MSSHLAQTSLSERMPPRANNCNTHKGIISPSHLFLQPDELPSIQSTTILELLLPTPMSGACM